MKPSEFLEEVNPQQNGRHVVGHTRRRLPPLQEDVRDGAGHDVAHPRADSTSYPGVNVSALPIGRFWVTTEDRASQGIAARRRHATRSMSPLGLSSNTAISVS